MFVVNRGQREAVEFACAKQVIDVCARVVTARVAVASFLQRAKIELVLGAFDVVSARPRVDRAVAGATCGGHAVEGVAAVFHAGEDVIHGGDAEHMTWTVLRHRVADPCAGVADETLLDRAADAHAVEVQRGDLRGRVSAQILVIRALHHAIQRLIRLPDSISRQPLVLVHASAGPAERAFHRILLVGAGVHQRGELIEREHDVRAELVLDAHRNLGGETMCVTIQRRLECHAVLVHPGHAFLALGDDVVRLHAGHVHRQRLLEADAQRHDLETAGIGERGPIPVHETRQAAGRVQHVLARALEQVEGVGQQALCT